MGDTVFTVSSRSAAGVPQPVAGSVLAAVAGADESHVVKLDATGKVVTGSVGLFERVVLFFRDVHGQVTRQFLSELKAKLHLPGNTSLPAQSLGLARGKPNSGVSRATPFTVGLARRTDGVATRLMAQKEWRTAAGRVMYFHAKRDETTWCFKEFAQICRDLGLPSDALDQRRSELYHLLLIRHAHACTGKEIPVDLGPEDGIRYLRPIARECLQHVMQLSDEQVEQEHAAWQRAEAALQQFLARCTGTDPAALAGALRELQGAIRGVAPRASPGEGPVESNTRALQPAAESPGLPEPLVTQSRSLVLAPAIRSLSAAEAFTLYHAAMGPQGAGRALIFAAHVNERQLAERARQMAGRELAPRGEAPQAVITAATHLRQLAHDVFHDLALQACLDPQEIEGDLATLEQQARDAAESLIRDRPIPGPDKAQTLYYDGFDLDGAGQIREQRQTARVGGESLIARLIGHLRIQSGVEAELGRNPASSRQRTEPPQNPQPSEAAERMAQARSRAQAAVEVLTLRPPRGSSPAPGTLTSALRELHLAICAAVPHTPPQASREARLKDSRARMLRQIIGKLSPEQAAGLYRQAMAVGGAGRALIFAACINERQLDERREYLRTRTRSRDDISTEVAETATDLRVLACDLFTLLGIQGGMTAQTVADTMVELERKGNAAGQTLVADQSLPEQASTPYHDGLSVKGIRQIREQQLAAGVGGGGHTAALIGQLRLQSGVAAQLLRGTPLSPRAQREAASPQGQDAQPPPEESPASSSSSVRKTASVHPQGTGAETAAPAAQGLLVVAAAEAPAGDSAREAAAIAPASEGPPPVRAVVGAISRPEGIARELETLDPLGTVPAASPTPVWTDPFLQALQRSQIAVHYAGQTVALIPDDFGATPQVRLAPLASRKASTTPEELSDEVRQSLVEVPLEDAPLAERPAEDPRSERSEDSFEIVPEGEEERPAPSPGAPGAEERGPDALLDPLAFLADLFGTRELVRRTCRLVHQGIAEVMIRRIAENEPAVQAFLDAMGAAKPATEFGAVLASDQNGGVRVEVHCRVGAPREPRRSPAPGLSTSRLAAEPDPPRSSLEFNLVFRVPSQGPVEVLEDPTYRLVQAGNIPDAGPAPQVDGDA